MRKDRYATYEDTVSVACVNYQSIWGDKSANLKKMKEKIVEAAEAGINLIVFPELALSGYECTETCTMHAENAELIPGPSTEEIAELAARHDIYVIFGMPERDKIDPDTRYISAAVIGPEGILGAYRKLYLGAMPRFREMLCFKPGKELPVFETRYGLIGVQICADLWYNPEQSRILVLKGARLIVTAAGSLAGPDKPYFLVQQTGARATENCVYAATANMVGTELTLSFYGHSTIAGPAYPWRAHIFAEGGETEEIVCATLNFKRLESARKQLRPRENLGIKLKELSRIAEAGAHAPE